MADKGRRAAFDTAVVKAGIVLSEDERDSVFKLASWMSDGIARLDDPFAVDQPALADAALDLSIFEQGSRLRDGRVSSVALVEACLRRIEQRDGAYRAFYAIDRERALADARAADEAFAEGGDIGHLHGIPVAVKDLIDVEGLATTADAPGRADAVAAEDAEAVKRLREAGAIVIGKLATYEWGTVGPDSRGLFPPARNPWSLEHITGGSSSGCAAAVAGGLLRTSVGTDTGGSLRGPAFYCGVVGLKPTFDAVSRDGVLDLAPSMDHVGPISASVAEAAVTLDALAGWEWERAAARLLEEPVRGLHLGYLRNWFAGDVQAMPEVVRAVDAAASSFSELGVSIEENDLPDYPAVEVAAAAILHAESFEYHREALREHPDHYGRRCFLSLAAGVAVTPEELAAARQAGRAFTQAVDDLLGKYDALMTVGALTTALPAAPFEKEAVWTPMRTIGFNVSGHPVLAMPIGFHQGLPIGMQLIGRHGDEARICQLGHAFEQATDFALQRPPAV